MSFKYKSPFGFLIIDKPKGLTSHDCVRQARKLLGLKKIGHGGTLDPQVTGVLPIALGNATRLFPYLTGSKQYIGKIQLGRKTTTDDLEGEVIHQAPWPKLEERELNKVLDQFRGSIKQKPPAISSIKINGERAYKRARRGESFDLPIKDITIFELTLIHWEQPTGQLSIQVSCSSGTYIRSIARDLGEIIGCGGCLANLRRTEAHGFTEKQMISLSKENLTNIHYLSRIIKPLKALDHLQKISLKTEAEISQWRHGRKIIASIDYSSLGSNSPNLIEKKFKDYLAVIDNNGELEGIASIQNCSPLIIQPKVVFNAIG